jgi:hypothetical protein
MIVHPRQNARLVILPNNFCKENDMAISKMIFQNSGNKNYIQYGVK